MTEDLLEKIDIESVALFIKVFGESMKEVFETGDFDMDKLTEKAGEHYKEVLEYLIKKEGDKD